MGVYPASSLGEGGSRPSLYSSGVGLLDGRGWNKGRERRTQSSEPSAISADECFDLELLREAVHYQRWVLSGLGPRPTGEVLEVGAGIGNYTRWLSQSADSVLALEPDRRMASSIERMGLRNVTVLPSTLEELAGNDRRFDCVVLINVLEHIDDDQAALKITHELLRPEGYVGILVPAHSILYGALDAAYGHRRRYSRHDVESRLKNAGFRVRYARYFNPIGAIGWFLVGRVSGRGQLSRTSVALAERVAVPSGRMLERFGHLPFGQSIVAVGVKTERLGG